MATDILGPVIYHDLVTFAGGMDPQIELANIDSLDISGSLIAAGAGTFGTDVSVGDDLTVTDDASIGGDLVVTGTLGVTGAVTLSDTLAITGAVTASAALSALSAAVTNNATVGGTLGVTGAVTLASTLAAGATTITGALGAGATTLSSTLAVAGASSLHNTTVTGTLGVSSTAAVTGAATFGSTVGITGATTAAAITASGTVTTNGTLDVNAALDLAGATITYPANTQIVKRYVSQSIVHGDLTGGGTVSTIALTGEPTAMVPIAAYMVTSAATTSSDVGTTGLTCSVGIAGLVEGHLAAASIFGAAARKEAFGGTLLGSYRAADPIIATFTATGGDADCADIDSLAIKIVILYLDVSTE